MERSLVCVTWEGPYQLAPETPSCGVRAPSRLIPYESSDILSRKGWSWGPVSVRQTMLELLAFLNNNSRLFVSSNVKGISHHLLPVIGNLAVFLLFQIPSHIKWENFSNFKRVESQLPYDATFPAIFETFYASLHSHNACKLHSYEDFNLFWRYYFQITYNRKKKKNKRKLETKI